MEEVGVPVVLISGFCVTIMEVGLAEKTLGSSVDD